MKIRPLQDRALIRKRMKPDKTPGGILLPESAAESDKLAEVVAVGPGRLYIVEGEATLIEMAVSVGDIVIVSDYGGVEFKDGDDKLHMVREDDILGIVIE